MKLCEIWLLPKMQPRVRCARTVWRGRVEGGGELASVAPQEDPGPAYITLRAVINL